MDHNIKEVKMSCSFLKTSAILFSFFFKLFERKIELVNAGHSLAASVE